MKLRILKKRNVYYIQKKSFFRWKYYGESGISGPCERYFEAYEYPDLTTAKKAGYDLLARVE